MVADRCFRPAGREAPAPSRAPSHTIHYGHVFNGHERVDEVLLSVMRAPRTFTREDVVEISCHGGVFATRQVLQAVLSAGARPAEPGEFTRRAFLNGRIDLTQAEAVADIIHARTELALAAAQEQLGGRLSKRINEVRDGLMRVLAHVEAHIDFPDEDIAPHTRGQLLEALSSSGRFIGGLLERSHEGQLLRRGIRVAIVGRPNAGKSSLLNLLLGRDRAIVSPIAGTTRDTIEETANIRGLPVVFIDTAGLRESGDVLEQEGVRRSLKVIAEAELLLHVVDGTVPPTPDDLVQWRALDPKRRVRVFAKADLCGVRVVDPEAADAIWVSNVTGEGEELLKDRIRSKVGSGDLRAEMLEAMVNVRHQDALRRAHECIGRAEGALRGEATLELVALDLRMACQCVGEIVGKTATEDLLDSIFSQFCIGK